MVNLINLSTTDGHVIILWLYCTSRLMLNSKGTFLLITFVLFAILINCQNDFFIFIFFKEELCKDGQTPK